MSRLFDHQGHEEHEGHEGSEFLQNFLLFVVI
jgi:hypothetical protein